MKFDFSALAKLIEQNQLMIQFLYSIALERRVTLDDYKSVKPQNIQNEYVFDIWAKCISDLDQNAQIEYYKVMLGANDLIDEYFTKSKVLLQKIEDLTSKPIEESDSMSESEEQLISEGITLSNNLINAALDYLAALIQRLHASVFKKIVISLLRNGVDINRIIQAKSKSTDKEYIIQKIRDEMEKIPDELQKEKIKNYLCNKFNIDPDRI